MWPRQPRFNSWCGHFPRWAGSGRAQHGCIVACVVSHRVVQQIVAAVPCGVAQGRVTSTPLAKLCATARPGYRHALYAAARPASLAAMTATPYQRHSLASGGIDGAPVPSFIRTAPPSHRANAAASRTATRPLVDDRARTRYRGSCRSDWQLKRNASVVALVVSFACGVPRHRG